MNVHVRKYRPQDLGQVLQLWEQTLGSSAREDWLTLDQAVDLLTAEQTVALVAEAERDGAIVGQRLAGPGR